MDFCFGGGWGGARYIPSAQLQRERLTPFPLRVIQAWKCSESWWQTVKLWRRSVNTAIQFLRRRETRCRRRGLILIWFKCVIYLCILLRITKEGTQTQTHTLCLARGRTFDDSLTCSLESRMSQLGGIRSDSIDLWLIKNFRWTMWNLIDRVWLSTRLGCAIALVSHSVLL